MKIILSRTEEKKVLDKEDYVRLAHFRYRLRRFLRASESLCQENGLTSLQYQLLLQLKGDETREWATIGELAEQLQSKHHGVVALIDRCEKSGLVERRPGREDRRQVEVHLLPRADELVSRIAVLHQNEVELLRDEFNAPGWFSGHRT
ncbi:MAG: MarR family transcriptional regulator [Sterolibacterium sp.]|nr:MarR family transcriptional regulator [Sterolibacterium sp.]MBP9799600.1 MarR family transcriptional regulator [Sterolibacterium sp.]